MHLRKCLACGKPVAECMGFVVIRDFLLLLEGKKIIPREFCDKCGFIMLFHPDPFLKLIELTHPVSL